MLNISDEYNNNLQIYQNQNGQDVMKINCDAVFILGPRERRAMLAYFIKEAQTPEERGQALFQLHRAMAQKEAQKEAPSLENLSGSVLSEGGE